MCTMHWALSLSYRTLWVTGAGWDEMGRMGSLCGKPAPSGHTVPAPNWGCPAFHAGCRTPLFHSHPFAGRVVSPGT